MKKLLPILLLINLFSINSQEFRTLLFTDYYGQIEPSTEYENLRARAYIRPSMTLDLFDYTTTFDISVEGYYDYFAGDDIEDQVIDPQNILRECYFAIYPDWGDILIGQRLITKSKAEVFSPFNVFDASYREVFSMDGAYQGKLAQLGAEVRFYPDDDSSIELLYVPFPRTDYQDNNTISVDIDGQDYSLNLDSPGYIMEDGHSVYLNYNKYGFSYDMAFMYSYYIDSSYNYVIDYDDNTIEKTYNRVHSIAGSLSTSIGSVGITEELGFNLTEDFDGTDEGIRNSDITLNTQLTKTLFGRTYGQVSLIYQYIFNYDEAEENSFAQYVYDMQLQPRTLDGHLAFFVFHLHDSFLREKLAVSLNAAFFFSPSVYLAPKAAYYVSDRFTVESGIDMYTGEWEANPLSNDLGGDNFYFRLKYEI